MPDLNEQATVVNDFLVGLLDAFGLEGSVETSIEGEDIIIANITGEQAEALIGPKGSILQAILELARTVVQRKTQAGARLRLDIGGYTARRREALKIYAAGLVEQVLEDGEEVMLEPMNPADRKVVHDAVAEVDGVRSYSEGEEPRRCVVISPAPVD
ncbi:MAG: single-stranded DNA-binding protein [Acidimicrobiia bacterium]|nr:single-stranded DNA-binding protein [Acidimicrobiia bacterium]